MSRQASSSANLAHGYPIAVVAAAFLSTTAIFIRHLTQTYQVPALVLALWRDVFVALTLLPVLRLFYPALLRVNRQHLRYLAAYGLLLSIPAPGRRGYYDRQRRESRRSDCPYALRHVRTDHSQHRRVP